VKIYRRLTAPIIAAALVLTACNATQSQAPGASQAAGGEQLHVYFATFAIGNAFWGLMEKGANDAAAQNGVKVTWTQGTEFSVDETVTRMTAAIAAKPDVMVVTDIDPGAFEPLMEQAQSEGIAVININAASAAEDPPYLFYVGADEYLAGQAAGQAVLDHSPSTPTRAACAIQVQGHIALEARCQGYTDLLKGAGVTVDKIDVAGGPTEAESKATAYFQANPDASAIYTLTAGPEAFDPILGVVQGLDHDVVMVTNDTSEAAFTAIQNGDVAAAIDQQPYLQGYLPVIWAKLYKDYAMLPAGGQILTGPFVIDDTNVDQIVDLTASGYR
jgi:simple sugar transport system substrate-binding protein